ncbi:MAG: response regulator [Burkholderiaceae bacterium]
MTTVRVALVEDNPTTRARLLQVLRSEPSVDLVFVCDCATDMMRWLDQNTPDVLLVDLGLPDRPGFDVIDHCLRTNPATDVMVITMFGDEVNTMAAFSRGARGYLLKDGSEQELARHVMDLHAGGSPMTPVIARQVLNRLVRLPVAANAVQTSGLSDRELEMLSTLARGYTYQEVADLLGISVRTVQSHVKNIYSKLGVHSRAEAVFEARSMGLL